MSTTPPKVTAIQMAALERMTRATQQGSGWSTGLDVFARRSVLEALVTKGLAYKATPEERPKAVALVVDGFYRATPEGIALTHIELRNIVARQGPMMVLSTVMVDWTGYLKTPGRPRNAASLAECKRALDECYGDLIKALERPAACS